MHEVVMVEQAGDHEKRQYAKRRLREFRMALHGTMASGYMGYEFREKNMWRDMGYESEHDFRDREGVARSTWFKMMRIAEGLKRLTQEEFIRLKEANADILRTLPEEVRYDGEWLNKAESMTAEQFAKEVEASNAAAQGVEPQDVRVVFKMSMYAGQRDAVVEGLKEFAMEFGLGDDLSRALELIVAEYRSTQQSALSENQNQNL